MPQHAQPPTDRHPRTYRHTTFMPTHVRTLPTSITPSMDPNHACLRTPLPCAAERMHALLRTEKAGFSTILHAQTHLQALEQVLHDGGHNKVLTYSEVLTQGTHAVTALQVVRERVGALVRPHLCTRPQMEARSWAACPQSSGRSPMGPMFLAARQRHRAALAPASSSSAPGPQTPPASTAARCVHAAEAMLPLHRVARRWHALPLVGRRSGLMTGQGKL